MKSVDDKRVTGAVIVAAGMSTRMEQFKQLMKVGGMTMAERVVDNFHRAGIREIVMVTGYQSDLLKKALSGQKIQFLYNADYETTQMFDSAKIGLEYLKDRCARILFCPVDIPFFTVDTTRRVMDSDHLIACPSYRGKSGHPIAIDSRLVPEILAYQGKGGLEGALDHLKFPVDMIEVDDPGLLMDADTKEDFQKLVSYHNSRSIRPEIDVFLANGRRFLGPGSMSLLKNIQSLGSVREACEYTGISYSKGWGLIRQIEEGLGYRIVERQNGGKDGGMAYVTEDGKRLMEQYERFECQLKELAKEEYQKLFLTKLERTGSL